MLEVAIALLERIRRRFELGFRPRTMATRRKTLHTPRLFLIGRGLNVSLNRVLSVAAATPRLTRIANRATLPAGAEIVEGDGRLLAGAIGKIAASHPELARDPAEIDANYVRRSDAELLWRKP